MVELLTPVCWGAVSTSESDELEEEEDEESLELSEAMPVDSCRSTWSASAARSGRSCFRTLKGQRRGQRAQNTTAPPLRKPLTGTTSWTVWVALGPFCATRWGSWWCWRSSASQRWLCPG